MARQERTLDIWWLLLVALGWLALEVSAGYLTWRHAIAKVDEEELQVLLLALVVAVFWKTTAIPFSILRFHVFEKVGRRVLRLRNNPVARRNFLRSGFDSDGGVRPAYESQIQELQQSVNTLIQLAGKADNARETVQRCGFDRFEDAKYVGEEFVHGRIVVFWDSFTEEELKDLLANARSESVKVAAQRALDGEEWE